MPALQFRAATVPRGQFNFCYLYLLFRRSTNLRGPRYDPVLSGVYL